MPTEGKAVRSSVIKIDKHRNGCYAPMVGKECDCPTRVYWAADEVLDWLRTHDDPPYPLTGVYVAVATDLEHRFSGEGAS